MAQISYVRTNRRKKEMNYEQSFQIYLRKPEFD